MVTTMLPAGAAMAQQDAQLAPVVVSASRAEEQRFDAAASIDAVKVDPFLAGSSLVNLSELLSAVPGIQVRERENYAQDLQLSIRGFGTRSTFGVRGVRILIDGIPATMPDGQGQVATASLTSARSIEVLRGPVAQLYGNAAGGVVQIFTMNPPFAPDPSYVQGMAGAGSDGQRRMGVTMAGGGHDLAGLLDLSHFRTDGYRDHSAAERNQLNGKAIWKLTADTKLTGIVNVFNQPLAEDPLGLTRAQFESNPRQSVAAALAFNTRKTVGQQQVGLLLEHRLSKSDTLNARLYGGTRNVFQSLGFAGSAPESAGGIVDLNNRYGGAEISWTRATKAYGMPLNWTIGIDTDTLDQSRRGFVNQGGESGALRRDETDRASNTDLFGQIDWMPHLQWKVSFGARISRVRLAVDDRYVTAASPNDSGSAVYRNASPVLGLAWYARDNLNVYANVGRGFETPTLTEIAYRRDGAGPNLALRPSRSRQGEIGLKWRSEKSSLDLALFDARSSDEIVPLANDNGRAIFQNIDQVRRRGFETSWRTEGNHYAAQVAYTLLDASFGRSFLSGANGAVAAGNRLPGTPMHSLFTRLEYRPRQDSVFAAEMRAESKVHVDDLNSEAAPGHAVFNLQVAREFRIGSTRMMIYGRIDNLFDRNYAGSVIVNESNRRFYEPAAGRQLFVGIRANL